MGESIVLEKHEMVIEEEAYDSLVAHAKTLAKAIDHLKNALAHTPDCKIQGACSCHVVKLGLSPFAHGFAQTALIRYRKEYPENE